MIRNPAVPLSRGLWWLLAAALALSATVFAASPARAATARLTIGAGKASFPQGYVCLWVLSDYTGTGYAFFNSETNYATLPAPFNGIQDNSWSFYNNGFAGSVEDVRLFRNAGQAGEEFVLCRGDAIPYLPPNGELPQSGSNALGWRDTVSSHKWGDFC
jgi:hypothetical protein